MFGVAVEEQRPGHAYVWKAGSSGSEADLHSWAQAYDTTKRTIEEKRRPGFAPIAL